MKRVIIIKGGVFLLVLILYLKLASAALGISPAMIEINFEPGYTAFFDIRIFEDNPEVVLNLYVEGDLAQYVTLDKTNMTGSGTYRATLKLPDKIETPGLHKIFLGSRETAPRGSGISASLDGRAVLKIYVPYPGKYAEITEYSASNINQGENERFKLIVASRGIEDLDAKIDIAILSNNETIDSLDLGTEFIKSGQEIEIIKEIESNKYTPGDYLSKAVVSYPGGRAEQDSPFRIGMLFVKIDDFTKKFKKDAIGRFDISIASLWNNKLDNIYALVNITKDSKSLTGFKTPSLDLKPWQNVTLTGYLDTAGIPSGKYNADIELFYGNSTKFSGEIQIAGFNYLYAVVVVIVMIIIAAGIVYYYVKSKKGKRK